MCTIEARWICLKTRWMSLSNSSTLLFRVLDVPARDLVSDTVYRHFRSSVYVSLSQFPCFSHPSFAQSSTHSAEHNETSCCGINNSPIARNIRWKLQCGNCLQRVVSESAWFWRWYLTHKVHGFVDCVHRSEFYTTRKWNVWENCSVCFLSEGRETTNLLHPLGRTGLNYGTSATEPSSHLRTQENRYLLFYTWWRTMDEVHKPSDSDLGSFYTILIFQCS